MKKILALFALLVVAFALVSCPEPRVPEDYQITVFPPYTDGGVDAEISDVPAECRVACENLAKLGCPESAPSGRTCGSVCASVVQTGARDLNLWCVANASTPDQVRACGSVRCKGR